MNTTTLTPQSWARALLTAMHYPVTANNMTTILAWEYAEGGHFHNGAHWNPLNTTRDSAKYGRLPGNSAGVAVYPDFATGLAQTVATLNLAYYGAVRRDLAASAPPSTTTAAVAASPWGTWHGSSPAPFVQMAARDVRAHPSWILAKPGHAGGKANGAKPVSGGNSTGATIVLDLPELGRLSSVYAQASDRVTTVRRKLQDLAENLSPACAALPHPWLSELIQGLLGALTSPMTGFDSNARQMSDLADYTGRIRTLAQQADTNHNGKYSTAEKVRFLETHPYHKNDRAWAAVVAALEGGTIRRAVSAPSGIPAKPPVKPRQGSQPNSRAKRVDAVLALASRQHASEHNGDNVVKYNEWFGDPGQPWCATFVSWVFYHTGNPLPAIQGPKGFAYVPYAISYARAHHQLSNTPHPGDVFLLKDGSHTGIVSKVYPNGTFDTVEGNYANQVAHVHRNSHDGSYYFWTAIR